MQKDYQSIIFELVKQKINGQDSLGNALGELLSISSDAVYRRYRGETQLTIYELEKIARHYSISLDNLFGVRENQVIFDFSPLAEYDFSRDSYLNRILSGFKSIRAGKNPSLIATINNTPLLQILNFPHLVRFKLFFWAKTHLQIEEYADVKFKREKATEKTFLLGREVLQNYNAIPSKELIDPDFLRGFVREIQYYFNAHHFEDRSYAIHLLDYLLAFVAHFKRQCELGKKFIYGTQPPAEGNDFEVYHNEVLNGISSTFYQNSEADGLYLVHNIMNPLHTSNAEYVLESRKVLDKEIANASIISVVNERERNHFFHQIETMILRAKKQMELELEQL